MYIHCTLECCKSSFNLDICRDLSLVLSLSLMPFCNHPCIHTTLFFKEIYRPNSLWASYTLKPLPPSTNTVPSTKPFYTSTKPFQLAIPLGNSCLTIFRNLVLLHTFALLKPALDDLNRNRCPAGFI